jgi:uncharacterized damage-inducible protein DinB
MRSVLINDIIQQLRDVEKADLWIDENFAKKLSQVNELNAFIRPLPQLHSIAELVSHLIEWRREVISRLQGNKRRLAMSDAANWKTNEELKERAWKNLQHDFQDTQQQVIGMLEGKDDTYLDIPYPHADADFPYNFKYLLTGLIHHDMYHLGQMGITIKYLNIVNLTL